MRGGPVDPTPSVDAAETVTFRYEVDEDEPPSHALVTVLSAVTGRSPTELDPLGRHVDLESLNALLASSGERARSSASVEFRADGFSVAVRRSEIVGVARRDVTDCPGGGP